MKTRWLITWPTLAVPTTIFMHYRLNQQKVTLLFLVLKCKSDNDLLTKNLRAAQLNLLICLYLRPLSNLAVIFTCTFINIKYIVQPKKLTGMECSMMVILPVSLWIYFPSWTRTLSLKFPWKASGRRRGGGRSTNRGTANQTHLWEVKPDS